MATPEQLRIETRLPPIVVPTHYDLFYKRIDLEQHKFNGTVVIKVKATKDAQRWHRGSLLVHVLDLNLLSCALCVEGTDRKWEAEELRYNKRNQTCEIIFDKDQSVWTEGMSYDLAIDFVGVLNDLMRGLYRSTYLGLDGKSHTMATTQFEPTDARRAFPCFDEPALKATFCLKVTVPTSLHCISNTPVASLHTSCDGNTCTKTITYQETPKMSTYLVALVVGEFDAISQTSGSIVTTVYTVPGKARQGQFCLDVAVKCLDLYQKLFDIPYPLVKSDLLAIPDFAAGAMENWGCVTYREAKILVKDESTSESTKRGIARTVCHELAHQWFGNLVTMEFWTQLWLKEGVARFMEFVGIDSIFPEWDAWTEFVQSVYGLALGLDSMQSSHPVEVVVRSADEINEIFDAISYAKGASIIRMVSSLLGFHIFLDGMKLYLSRHAYGNATTEMLWYSLEEASGKPVAALMNPWTSQTGFPVLILPENEGGKIRTPRFLACGPDGEDGKRCVWPIPVTAMVQGSSDVLGPWIINGPSVDESEKLLAHIRAWTDDCKWFKLNVAQTGFYRVVYTRAQWDKLAKVISPLGPLPAADRLGLISDSFASGRAGYTSIVDSLHLVKDFGEHETAEYAVWQELSENLANLASLYRSEPFIEKFQGFLCKIFSKQMSELGWEASQGESQRTGTLRGIVVNMLGMAGDEKVSDEAFRRFCEFEKDPSGSKIPGDMQGIIFRIALCHDEEYVYPRLKRLYEYSSFPEEQRNCLLAMGCVKDLKRHREMFDYVLFSGKVRLQDVAFPLSSLSSTTDKGGRACWELFRELFDIIKFKFGSGPMWGACVGLCCRGLRTSTEANEVEEFFRNPSHPPGSAKRRLAQALESVSTRGTRLARDRLAVTKFLEHV